MHFPQRPDEQIQFHDLVSRRPVTAVSYLQHCLAHCGSGSRGSGGGGGSDGSSMFGQRLHDVATAAVAAEATTAAACLVSFCLSIDLHAVAAAAPRRGSTLTVLTGPYLISKMISSRS
jgi:hypothetical protein